MTGSVFFIPSISHHKTHTLHASLCWPSAATTISIRSANPLSGLADLFCGHPGE